jgi:hypothetical protein
VIVALYGFCLFLWWWKKVGQASEIYIYFTILLLSEAIYNFFNALARYFRDTNDIELYWSLMDSPIWVLRAVFHLLVLSTIIGCVTVRAIKTTRKANRFKVEEDDVPNTNR